jgi:hypothetical protein
MRDLLHSACGKIDGHNRLCRDTLGLERKLGTHDWSMRVNQSISLAWFLWTHGWHLAPCALNQKWIRKGVYTRLSEELIDNNYDSVGGIGLRQRNHAAAFLPHGDRSVHAIAAWGEPRSGIDAHLIPTKKNTKYSQQN